MTRLRPMPGLGAAAGAVAASRRRARWKRPLDLGLVILCLPALLPLMALIALAICGSGPVLFRQTRIGQHGQPFTLLKFRSMVPDAEAQGAAAGGASDRAGPCFKARRDPRTTRLGAVLRRLSLDELPQLFNVLRGEMSLVGPRPALPSEVAVWPLRALARHAVLPGLTGPWQVGGRAELSFDEMIMLDLAYAADLRLGTDLRLLARTAGAVLWGRGAW